MAPSIRTSHRNMADGAAIPAATTTTTTNATTTRQATATNQIAHPTAKTPPLTVIATTTAHKPPLPTNTTISPKKSTPTTIHKSHKPQPSSTTTNGTLWADRVRVSNSTTRARIASFPRQSAGSILEIPDNVVAES